VSRVPGESDAAFLERDIAENPVLTVDRRAR
jgi:hypothetical protein